MILFRQIQILFLVFSAVVSVEGAHRTREDSLKFVMYLALVLTYANAAWELLYVD